MRQTRIMCECPFPASALKLEIGPVTADTDQFRIGDGAPDQFKSPEQILMPFAQKIMPTEMNRGF